MSDEIFQQIREIIANKLSISPEEIKPESDIMEDLGADSLDVQDLILTIEDRWNIEFPVEEADKFRTVGDVVEALKKLEEQRASGG